ncbi:MAG TPA: hypothetical protein VGD64_03235, partial [Acidisarcina sp.]
GRVRTHRGGLRPHGTNPDRKPRSGTVTMGKKIAWTEQGKADLRAIDQVAAIRILHTISRYLAIGEGDVKRLQDVEPPEFRLRSGDYRVRFHGLSASILVLAVKHRREAYR